MTLCVESFIGAESGAEDVPLEEQVPITEGAPNASPAIRWKRIGFNVVGSIIIVVPAAMSANRFRLLSAVPTGPRAGPVLPLRPASAGRT